MLESQRLLQMNPIKCLEERIGHIKSRIGEASDIFERKFSLIQDQIGSMCEKIEEDKLFQQEIKLLRQQEIEMMSREADAFFS